MSSLSSFVFFFLYHLQANARARVLARERPSVDRYTGGLTPFSFHSVGHSTIRDPINNFAVHCRRRANIYSKEKVSKCVHASNFIFVWIIHKSGEQNRTFEEIVVPKIEFSIANGKFQLFFYLWWIRQEVESVKCSGQNWLPAICRQAGSEYSI